MEEADLATKEEDTKRDGRSSTRKSELPMNWASTKSKSFLEWSYRHSIWKPLEQGLTAEPKPPARRPSSGHANGRVRRTTRPRPSSSRPSMPPSTGVASQGCEEATAAFSADAGKEGDKDSTEKVQKAGARKVQFFKKTGQVKFLQADIAEDSAGESALQRWLQVQEKAPAANQYELLAEACSENAQIVADTMRTMLQARSNHAAGASRKLRHYEQEFVKRKSIAEEKAVRAQPKRDDNLSFTGLELSKLGKKRESLFGTESIGGLAKLLEGRDAFRQTNDFSELTEGDMSMQEAKDLLRQAGLMQQPSEGPALPRLLEDKTAGAASPRSMQVTTPKTTGKRKPPPKKGSLSAWRANRRAAMIKGEENEDLSSRLHSAFAGATAQVRKVEKLAKDSLTLWELQQIAMQVNLPFAEAQYAKKVFEELDLNVNGTLDYSEFEKLSVRIVGASVSSKEVKRVCRETWAQVANERTGMINFLEFLRWYSRQTFDDNTLAKRLQGLAQQYNVTVETIETVRYCFNSVDTDQSGYIEMPEFKQILAKIMRIPPGVELPASRIQGLWMEMDASGDSEVSFEEFLPWWIRRRDTLLPYEGFYAGIRRLGAGTLDPPAYPRKKSIPEIESSEHSVVLEA